MMTNEELVLELHRYFNGDTKPKYGRVKAGKRWVSTYEEVPYTAEDRLNDSTYMVFRATDGHNSIAALTYREILEALEVITGVDN